MPTSNGPYTCIEHMKPHFCVFCGTHEKNPDLFFLNATELIDKAYLADVPGNMLDEICLL